MRGRDFLGEHLRKNRLLYIAALTAYLVGLCLGAGMAASVGAEQSQALSGDMERFLSQSAGETEPLDVMKVCVMENLKYTVFSFLVSLSIWTAAANGMFLGFKGFSTGFTAGFAVRCYGWKGTWLSALTLFPSCMVMLPIYLLMCVMCVRFAASRRGRREYPAAGQPNREVLWFGTTMVLLFAVLCVCSLVDALIAPALVRLFF
ncbi:MAG: hypothetical protein E7409_01165 [Ruminococcaceae bacterium]|nr:hypothetical protein [Oscillospiraceae bacterium]